jgi:hypothetical protein
MALSSEILNMRLASHAMYSLSSTIPVEFLMKSEVPGVRK